MPILKLQKNIIKTAKDTLLIEARSIEKLVDTIDQDFEQCVQAIFSSKGRIVVTGIGKSANIGAKIVSTLNSTGTPSLFMHAADAIHGDLGMVQPNDMVMCLSKSGNTAEIKVLVPLIKRLGVPIIALVGNKQSYLAKKADFVLNASVDQEADPNNLAPTASAVAAMALGDALAVCLLSMRSFDSRDFAELHPGGSLGKRLYLKVNDIGHLSDFPQVSDSASLKEVIYEISSKRLGATAVTTEEDQLLGIITDGDLRRMLDQQTDWSQTCAQEIMTKAPITINFDAYAVDALNKMKENNITQLIIVNKQNQVEGFIHIHDLLKEGIV